MGERRGEINSINCLGSICEPEPFEQFMINLAYIYVRQQLMVPDIFRNARKMLFVFVESWFHSEQYPVCLMQ